MAFSKKSMASPLTHPHLAKMQQAARNAGMTYKRIAQISGTARPAAVKPTSPVIPTNNF